MDEEGGTGRLVVCMKVAWNARRTLGVLGVLEVLGMLGMRECWEC